MSPKDETTIVKSTATAIRLPGKGLKLIGLGLLKAGQVLGAGAKLAGSGIAAGAVATGNGASRILAEARRQAAVEKLLEAHKQGKMSPAQLKEAEQFGITFSSTGGVVTAEIVQKDEISTALLTLRQIDGVPSAPSAPEAPKTAAMPKPFTGAKASKS